MFAAGAIVAIEEDDWLEWDAGIRELRLERRILRDVSDPFRINPEHFRKHYRLPVPVALRLVEILRASLSPLKADGVPAHLQVLSALRFYAEGTYQKGVGQDFRHPLSQAMISRIIERVTDAIIAVADNYIRFPHTREERILCAQGFARHIRIPGILGAVDCILVAHIKPSQNEEAFYNYKGYHALNVQIVSDANYMIQDIRICPGSNNDRHIWQHSEMKQRLESLRANADITRVEGRYYFLGDSGYTPSPVLLTPIRRAPPGTPEGIYTHHLVHTRCKVEQLFGIWTAVWRSIKRERKLPYDPEKVARIITACAVLHNFRRLHGVGFEISENDDDDDDDDNDGYDYRIVPARNMNYHAGIQERAALIDAYYRP